MLQNVCSVAQLRLTPRRCLLRVMTDKRAIQHQKFIGTTTTTTTTSTTIVTRDTVIRNSNT